MLRGLWLRDRWALPQDFKREHKDAAKGRRGAFGRVGASVGVRRGNGRDRGGVWGGWGVVLGRGAGCRGRVCGVGVVRGGGRAGRGEALSRVGGVGCGLPLTGLFFCWFASFWLSFRIEGLAGWWIEVKTGRRASLCDEPCCDSRK